MQTILDEMFELGILGKIEHDHLPPTYCLRTRQVANMLGTEDEIIEELITLQDVEPPLDYNPSTNRRFMRAGENPAKAKDARHFSPLTDGQLMRLLEDTEVPGACFVTGTRALGLSNVAAAISDYAATLAEKPGRRNITILDADTQKTFTEALRKEPGRQREFKIVVFTPATTNIAAVLNFVDERASVQSGKIRPILILDASVPALREVAIRREAEALRPWGTEMLRTYLGLIEELPLDRTRATRGCPRPMRLRTRCHCPDWRRNAPMRNRTGGVQRSGCAAPRRHCPRAGNRGPGCRGSGSRVPGSSRAPS
jgi:hypothetical protein